MEITGKNIIGSTFSGTGKETFNAVDPATGAILPGQFHLITIDEATAVAAKATAAFKIYSKKTAEEKAVFLETIADEILAAGDALLNRAMQETGLPLARLTGERGRTMMQLKMFAQLL